MSRRRDEADVLAFRDLTLGDVPLVGGKNASLGEMVRELTPKGILVPDGFAVTAAAYRRFLRESGAEDRLRSILSGLDASDVENLRARGRAARHAILAAELPDGLSRAIAEAYRTMGGRAKEGPDVAVRSSATAEDLPEASFAGQLETYLNVRGAEALLHHVKRCFASLFTDRAISYRAGRGYDHLAVSLSVGVQHMVRSDLACAGVMFTLDTESGFRDAVLLNASWGLGETVVQGAVNPDEFTVFKPTLRSGFRPILHRVLGTKEFKLVYDPGGERMTRSVPVAAEDRRRFCLSDDEVLQLARWACLVEEHVSRKRGQPTPLDLEWAKDGRRGELYLVQARPETVQSRRDVQKLERHVLKGTGEVLAAGRSVGERIGAGPVHVIGSAQQLHEFRAGEVLVTDRTDPDWEPVMRRAAAVVTNRGGRTCHAAIVSRELGLPAVVGANGATERLKGQGEVTVSCAEGETGKIYRGRVPFEVQTIDLAAVPRPRTKVMMILGNPLEAFRLSFLPNDGVGLARLEFIITSFIKVHPNALLEYERLADGALKREIGGLTAGWDDKAAFFTDRLAEGVAMIAAAFWPKDVIVRLSDFKSNEYAGLVGGAAYEPKEENPMLGFRGASRYTDPRFRDAFALECRALRRVRDEMGLRNVKVMVPFCRTVAEGRKVVAEMAGRGLVQGENGLEIYVMCEIPSNVLEAEAFSDVFDGFSIGSNDLTQLTLGVDRDSEIVAHLFDERDPAVKKLIAQVIRTAKAKGRKIGICGQAPSDHPDYAAFLVREGIDSISLNPDALLKGRLRIAEAEHGGGQ